MSHDKDDGSEEDEFELPASEDIDEAVKDIADVSRRAVRTLIARAYNSVVLKIQEINFERNLNPGEKKVLREVMDFCIEQRRTVS